MSRFKIYEKKDQYKDAYVSLEYNKENEIRLVAVDECGEIICNLLMIENNGSISLFEAVKKDLGFKLDEFGQIIINR